MKIINSRKIEGGQDGAIWNDFLFRFDHKGLCFVYKLQENFAPEEISSFTLDRADEIAPHSNSVMFGAEYFEEGDEFPLLYTNIYNNYSGTPDKLTGVCLVYRITRNETDFSSSLVQMIEIGFTDNSELWCSENKDDIRPYGNFVIDIKNKVYYGFTMRDKTHTTRYFSFNLPKLHDGTRDEKYGINKIVLTENDIKDYFDCEYHNFVQGACFHNGKIYSLEGFTDHPVNHPVLRIIDVAQKKQTDYFKFSDFGLNIEPEMIDFKDDICYYSDNHGNLYNIEF